MKRLEDSGKVIHMSDKDREMISIFGNIAGDADYNDNSDEASEVPEVVIPKPDKLKFYYRRLAKNKAIIHSSATSLNQYQTDDSVFNSFNSQLKSEQRKSVADLSTQTQRLRMRLARNEQRVSQIWSHKSGISSPPNSVKFISIIN